VVVDRGADPFNIERETPSTRADPPAAPSGQSDPERAADFPNARPGEVFSLIERIEAEIDA
jgi:hypothetical protein